jgi:hypothetical protein
MLMRAFLLLCLDTAADCTPQTAMSITSGPMVSDVLLCDSNARELGGLFEPVAGIRFKALCAGSDWASDKVYQGAAFAQIAPSGG